MKNDIDSRQVPSNIDAEQILLGSLFINPLLLYNIIDFLKSEHFFNPLHQQIYKFMLVIADKGLTANIVILKTMLNDNQSFQAEGGSEYLNKLITMAAMTFNPYDYAVVIYDLAIKRKLIDLSQCLISRIYNMSLECNASKHIEYAESRLYEFAMENSGEREFVKITPVVTECMHDIHNAIKSNEHIIGITTGFSTLDAILSGFHNSDLVIVAGRPSMGKTALAVNLALNACNSTKLQSNNIPQVVGFMSLEMSSSQLVQRMLSIYSKIDLLMLRNGKISDESYCNLRKAAEKISTLQYFIDDTPSLSISEIKTRARKLKRKHNLSILFIDYLQLIRGTRSYDNRVLEITEITQGLKAIAKELNIPIIVLSQLSRNVDTREDKRPMLHDLRDSGTIEQDADVVLFIFREVYYITKREPYTQNCDEYKQWQNAVSNNNNVAEIIVAKHRNGPTGNIKVFYDARHSLFADLYETGL